MSDDIGLFEAMYSCRAMRRLHPDPVPEAHLLRLIDAANQAASGRNFQRARWIIVRDGPQKRRVAELNRRASQLGHYLRRRGIGPDVLVGICIDRSIEMIVGLLGILKAGGAYVPIDPEYPVERISYMLEDIGAEIIVSSLNSSTKLPVSKEFEVISLEEDLPQISKQPKENLLLDISSVINRSIGQDTEHFI
jgi:non-ribosomal peptide synthetase component F